MYFIALLQNCCLQTANKQDQGDFKNKLSFLFTSQHYYYFALYWFFSEILNQFSQRTPFVFFKHLGKLPADTA